MGSKMTAAVVAVVVIGQVTRPRYREAMEARRLGGGFAAERGASQGPTVAVDVVPAVRAVVGSQRPP